MQVSLVKRLAIAQQAFENHHKTASIRDRMCRWINGLQRSTVTAYVTGVIPYQRVEVHCPENLAEQIKNLVMGRFDVDWYYEKTPNGFYMIDTSGFDLSVRDKQAAPKPKLH